MIAPPALWARDATTGRTAHLVETEDGAPRRLSLPGGPAWAGVCRVPTEAGPAPLGAPGVRLCPECAAIDALLRPAPAA